MGLRFRKSLRIMPGVRLNFSKSGVSTSLGGRGATINIGPKGTRYTVGLPGTGLSFSEFSPRKSRKPESAPPQREYNSKFDIEDERPAANVTSKPRETFSARKAAENAAVARSRFFAKVRRIMFFAFAGLFAAFALIVFISIRLGGNAERVAPADASQGWRTTISGGGP